MKQPSNPASRPSRAATALVAAIVMVGLYGAPHSGTAAQAAPDPSCGTARQATPPEPPTPDAEGADAPLTQAQGAAILKELRAIRLALQSGAAPRPGPRGALPPQAVKMQVVPGWYKLGRDDAPVTMVEFMDLQCPACRHFQTATFAEIKKDYIDSGKVLFIARDLPLPMHPYALGAAEAARCTGDQGKFWQFRDAVLDDQVPPTPDVLLKHVRELGLNLPEFQNCLKDGKHKQAIQDDQAEATTLGIHGTPGFVIGRTKGGVIEGLSMAGARPFPFFQQQIENMLNQSPSGLDGTSPPVRNP